MTTNYIISLTTIPTKFDNLHKTIDSIINQTILPKKIIINIPKIYNFRMNNTEIPIEKINNFINKYSKFNIFINLLDEDYGPGTKLLGLLNNTDIISDIISDNTYIILVDDDLIYKPYMIETYDKEININIKNNNIESLSCCTNQYGNLIVGQGADGFVIKYSLLNNFLSFYNLIKEYDYINYHDDFYISYYLNLININIKYITPPNNCNIYDTHDYTYIDALCYLEGKYSRSRIIYIIYDILNKLKNNGTFDFLQN
jgi:hypothetical protein